MPSYMVQKTIPFRINPEGAKGLSVLMGIQRDQPDKSGRNLVQVSSCRINQSPKRRM
jgi:hypothetical protein